MIEYTVKVFDSGNKYWYLNGELHRTDGPAIEYADGSKYWYLNGKLHHTDGPAIEEVDGYKRWYLNDLRHRTDGPAVERPSGTKHWFLNGEELTENEFNSRMKTYSYTGKIVEIDGKKYKLQEI